MDTRPTTSTSPAPGTPDKPGPLFANGRAVQEIATSSDRSARPIRNATPAIVIADAATAYSFLANLSDSNNPVTAVITPESSPFVNNIRQFVDMEAISNEFNSQGSMENVKRAPKQSTQRLGMSCGVEAVNNAGLKITASEFYAAHEAGASDCVVDGRVEDDHIDTGNYISIKRMFDTLNNHYPLKLDQGTHTNNNKIGESDFWTGRQWAIVLLPVCNGHWVSLEKIIYRGREAICLREGRGNATYDFSNPGGGHEKRLRAGVGKRKRGR